MNYELAKELKEAGFPQPDLLPVDGVQRLYGLGKGEWKSKNGGAIVYVPTLEELIAACGAGFGAAILSLHPTTKWAVGESVHDDDIYIGATYAEAPTLTEAITRLWLALNKKV
jgi:hypothetical protein